MLGKKYFHHFQKFDKLTIVGTLYNDVSTHDYINELECSL